MLLWNVEIKTCLNYYMTNNSDYAPGGVTNKQSENGKCSNVKWMCDRINKFKFIAQKVLTGSMYTPLLQSRVREWDSPTTSASRCIFRMLVEQCRTLLQMLTPHLRRLSGNGLTVLQVTVKINVFIINESCLSNNARCWETDNQLLGHRCWCCCGRRMWSLFWKNIVDWMMHLFTAQNLDKNWPLTRKGSFFAFLFCTIFGLCENIPAHSAVQKSFFVQIIHTEK